VKAVRGFWRVVAEVGRELMTAGIIVLLFVAYQLWGTGLAEHKTQSRLKRNFAAATAATPTTTAPPPIQGATTTATVPSGPPPTPTGQAVALIRIPKIGVDAAVVQGVGLPDLRKGPGHYPKSPLPGEPGNAAIAGHRTTYGAPFFRLNELKPGDLVLVTTRAGKFEYDVAGSKVVSPTASEVLNATKDNRLTLTTCNPRYSAAQRLVVWASLKGPAVDVPPPPPSPPTTVATPESPSPSTTVAPKDSEGEDEPGLGLSGTNKAWLPVILWGWVALTVWFTGRVLSSRRRWRRLYIYGITTPVSLVLLWFFFENVVRLLPANI
jgi:sortase A